MRWLGAMLALHLAGGAATAEPAIDLLLPEAFSKRCAERIQAKVPDVKIATPQPLQLQLRHDKSGESTIYLEAAYETYKQSPDKLDEILDLYAAGALEALPSASGVDAARIVPIVKPRAWLAAVGVADDAAQDEVVYDELNAELVVVYAEDTPSSLSYFSAAELKNAKIDRGGLRQLASTNLVRMLPKIERRGEDGVYVVAAGGEYETSLLAVGTGWKKDSFQVKGDFVFAAPARGSLYVTGSEDAEGLETVRGYARTIYRDSSQKISPELFVQRGGVLTVLPE